MSRNIGTRVDELTKNLTTLKQLQDALASANTNLDKAWELARETPFVATWAGLRKALQSRINGINTYAKKIKADLPQKDPVSYVDRQKVALTLVQSEDTLIATDKAVNDPDLRLSTNLRNALASIVGSSSKAVADAALTVVKETLPVLIPIAIGYGIFSFLHTQRHGRNIA